MAKLTNAQLVAQLEAAHVSYQALAAKHEALLAQQLTAKQPIAQRWVRRQPTVEQIAAHDEYARKLIAAREAAIRSGTSVRVS